jgi:hypothetical protein
MIKVSETFLSVDDDPIIVDFQALPAPSIHLDFYEHATIVSLLVQYAVFPLES